MSETKKSLYESLWEKGKDLLKELNKPIARKRDKRAFEGAYDEALDKGYQARQRLNKLLQEEIGNYGEYIDDIVEQYKIIKASEEVTGYIKELNLEVFGKELKTDE